MKATGATNLQLLVVRAEVSYLMQGMEIADYLAAKAGGLADVSAFATFKYFTRRPHDFIRQNLHEIAPAYDRMKDLHREEALKFWF